MNVIIKFVLNLRITGRIVQAIVLEIPDRLNEQR